MNKEPVGAYGIKSLPSIKGQSIDDFLYEGERWRCERERLLRNGGNGDHPQRYCECPEYLINGQRVPCPPRHSCKYTEARSALVPEASRLATREVGDPFKNASIGVIWGAEFNRQMDRLAYNANVNLVPELKHG